MNIKKDTCNLLIMRSFYAVAVKSQEWSSLVQNTTHSRLTSGAKEVILGQVCDTV